ncbi:protein phosphatase 2C domain-containing protein [Alkalihalobacillus sp. LMS39]|uniref:protein phosphatase 2C domain-containing protein n=1 Tax=Alkalihalobacillus sp. LMS39 TaxID=2924032 RepID=UPI001FB42819|nr:protein phosphatase 2C domain-containing protein [Alkalihalobacillus sp. LMS39]UOE95892.1 protein phosphatase 2C domain-containing protein [Alkalihalobacillus sp. LMS39]
MRKVEQWSWVGDQRDFIDAPHVFSQQHISIGRYGGNSAAGQMKNEDGCLVWSHLIQGWEFSIVVDAHHTSESANLIIQYIKENEEVLLQIFSYNNVEKMFTQLDAKIISLFQSELFLRRCERVRGEASCLLVARKENYVWWFSVGDCVLFVFHNDFAALQQFQVNQRQFFEWIGKENTFAQTVPSYSHGIRQLRKGWNTLFLTTDGIIECPTEPYNNPVLIQKELEQDSLEEGVQTLFETIRKNNVRDNTTLITWKVYVEEEGMKPSQ